MRGWAAITATLALLANAAQAPLAHTHRHDQDHRHAGLLPHAHLNPASHETPGLHAPGDDDDIQLSDLAAVVKAAFQPFVAVVAEPVALTVPTQQRQIVRAPAPRAHDPPGLRTLPPRAPPA